MGNRVALRKEYAIVARQYLPRAAHGEAKATAWQLVQYADHCTTGAARR